MFRAEVARHRFALCPPGNGFDTHRVYEALQLGAIPVTSPLRAPHPDSLSFPYAAIPPSHPLGVSRALNRQALM